VLIQPHDQVQPIVFGPGHHLIDRLPVELAPGWFDLAPGEDLDNRVELRRLGQGQRRVIGSQGVSSQARSGRRAGMAAGGEEKEKDEG
jgi:hypothetical protein